MATRVLFLLPYPLHQAPSQRFRVEAYFELMKSNGIHFCTDVFLDDAAWKILYQKGSPFQKAGSVVKGFFKRFYTVCFKAHRYDYIFLHREASPLGPPFFEWMLCTVLRKKIIYDFDDAIWIPNVSETNSLARFAKCFWKIKYICKWSYKISAGNHFLGNWARAYAAQVCYNPTCVDTVNHFNRQRKESTGKIVIGWTGSHSTLKYLDAIYPLLQKLEKEIPFEFLVICNQPPTFTLASLRFIRWREATEIEDLLQMDIGVMPLAADAWSEGKCGFKLIQYLSLGIPAIASPVGVNQQIIEQGVNGFLCTAEEDWRTALITLIKDKELRARLGQSGRQKMLREYSLQANGLNFLSLFS